MKKQTFLALKRTFLAVFALMALWACTEEESPVLEAQTSTEAPLAEGEFHQIIARIITLDGGQISQLEIAKVMAWAEQRKSANETASDYITNYMNANFKVSNATARSSTNRVSIAAPGQSDSNQSKPCGQTATQSVTSGTIGYYYAFAESCNGQYEYDSSNYTGGSTVFAYAEARDGYRTAFILH
ncbi:hypothetical protein WIW50_19550 [Flavobacteriaceae bacterium 3-367]|uniref:hypothetical protein n=1 Tax=Eudoraea algarum TaxID=3417568 RepID=UPI00326CA72D